MKKCICLVLTVLMTVLLTAPAFAARTCDCGHEPVIYVPGFGKSLYAFDEDGAQRIYPPQKEAFVKAALPIAVAAAALVCGMFDLFADYGMRAAFILLGRQGCGDDGSIPPGTGILSDNLPTEDVHGDMAEGIADYTFNYDWRLSPLDNAQLLHEFTQHVCALTGHDEVSFVCHSMGGCVLAAYLYRYGSAGVKRMICLTPAWQGVSIMGSLLSGEADIADKADELDLFLQSLPMLRGGVPNTLLRAAAGFGGYAPLLRFLQRALDSQFERVFYNCLRSLYGTMPGIWSFVSDKYYDRAKAFTFCGEDRFAALEAKTDEYHYEVQMRLGRLLQNAVDDGMQLYILSGYGISSLPLSREHTMQSDFLVTTEDMSIGAVCMPYGETLPDGYEQAVPDGHDHLSPDGLVDASACAFPEQTWFLRGMMHFAFPDDAEPFVLWALTKQTQASVHTDEYVPQFLVWE